MNKLLASISMHLWLKHKNEHTYHAYLKRTPGAEALCGDSPPLQNLAEMDIPGDRSACCNKCFSKLYGLKQYHFPIERL